jgi:hypothetical protein
VLSSRREISRDYVPSDGVKRVRVGLFAFLCDTSYHAFPVPSVNIRDFPLSEIDRWLP